MSRSSLELLFENLRRSLNENKYYYTIDPNDPPPIEQILNAWVKDHKKIYDPDGEYHAIYPLQDLLPYREYDWSKTNHRGSQKEWDLLKKSLAKGYDNNNPILLQIGANGKVKVGEGNHRIALAQELGIKDIPVFFTFVKNVYFSEYSFRYKPAPSPELDSMLADFKEDELKKVMDALINGSDEPEDHGVEDEELFNKQVAQLADLMEEVNLFEEELLDEIKVKDLKKQNPELVDVIDSFMQSLDNKYIDVSLRMYKEIVDRTGEDERQEQFNRIVEAMKLYDSLLKSGAFDRAIKSGGKSYKKAKNIDYFREIDIDLFETYMEQLRDKFGKSNTQKEKAAKASSEKIYEDERFLVIVPQSKEASCYYGKGTKWCISASDSKNYWDDYTGRDKWFVFIFDGQAAEPNFAKIAIAYDTLGDDADYEEIFLANDEPISSHHMIRLIQPENWEKINKAIDAYYYKKYGEGIAETWRADGKFFAKDIVRLTDAYKEELKSGAIEAREKAWEKYAKNMGDEQSWSDEVIQAIKNVAMQDALQNYRPIMKWQLKTIEQLDSLLIKIVYVENSRDLYRIRWTFNGDPKKVNEHWSVYPVDKSHHFELVEKGSDSFNTPRRDDA